jgi:Ni/Co efflux regulator RcnB
MRILLLAMAALIAAPTAAFADHDHGWKDSDEWHGGRGEDFREHEHERREDWREHEHDRREDWREHEHDRREAWREHREDVREAWRGRPEWRGYGGPRGGYWYAPGYGYRPFERGVAWRRGEYVPRAYRAYYVQEPTYYRLSPAPVGYRWVYGDGNFVLMALASGMIASVVPMGAPPPPAEPMYDSEGRYRQPVAIARNEDVWRGQDGHYYCRRSNGTTGLVIGAAAGALLGNAIDRHDRTTGTVVGAVGGGLIGREIDRRSLRCR